MHPKLIESFKKFGSLSTEEMAAIDSTMHEKVYKKGKVLLAPESVSNQAYFVIEGCVRQYYAVNGEEKTTRFFTDGEWVVSTHNMHPDETALHYLDCCTDCILLVGDSTKGEKLYQQFPNLETISRKLMQSVFIEQSMLLKEYVSDTPEERYLKLLKVRPQLFQQIPQYYIASYIGVKPESLSRIRKRIAEKKL